jgi:hypothetical protein
MHRVLEFLSLAACAALVLVIAAIVAWPAPSTIFPYSKCSVYVCNNTETTADMLLETIDNFVDVICGVFDIALAAVSAGQWSLYGLRESCVRTAGDFHDMACYMVKIPVATIYPPDLCTSNGSYYF